MKKNTEPLNPNCYYHIYNRGINSGKIFKEASNYDYFLKQYMKYILPVAETYAYCLLSNHFHLLIRIRQELEIVNNIKIDTGKPISFFISNQFAKFFNSYTQSYNKAYRRTGSLFESPFRRIEIGDDFYLAALINYIHQNPQNHGVINDFMKYKYSSYNSLISNKPTNLMRKEVLEFFGNKEAFINFHEFQKSDIKIEKYILE